VSKIKATRAVEFIHEIFNQFGIPRSIISDNKSQFTSQVLMEFCSENEVIVNFTSVAHPQSNVQMERANGLILMGLKLRIFDRSHPYAERWVEQLSAVVLLSWCLNLWPIGWLVSCNILSRLINLLSSRKGLFKIILCWYITLPVFCSNKNSPVSWSNWTSLRLLIVFPGLF
jgi:transposase InsO family protein